MKYSVKKGCEDLRIWGMVAGKPVTGKEYCDLSQAELKYLFEAGNEFIDVEAEPIKIDPTPANAKK
jgi:hypothetical protein